MEYQRTGGKPPSPMDRIVHAAKSVGAKIQEANNSPTGRAIRNFAEHVNAQDGSGGRAPPPGPRRRAQQIIRQPEAQVNPGSALHPGNRIYVIEGSILASGGGQKASQQQRRSHPLIRRGGLGQEDTGFDDDRGL